MGRRRRARLLALTAALAAVCLPVLALLAEDEPEPVRILLVGDSVTQGSSGDWTWRYRLWEHLTASGVDVDLVGPRDDLLDPTIPAFGSQEYVDPDFDRDHAARWGMSLADLDQPIGELVRDYEPDVVVELLGVNDVVWRKLPPSDVVADLDDLVTEARAVDPDVDIVLGQLPQVWFEGVAELNARLPALADRLDADSSRVVTAATGQGFVEGVHTYDPAHLSASGEVRLVAGVADALAQLGVGASYPRPLPDVPDGPRQTAFLTAQPSGGAVHLTWRRPTGATGEYIWIRDRSIGEPWVRLPWPVRDTAWTAGALVDGHVYEFRVQSAKGAAVAEDLYSNVVTVRPGPPLLPALPAPLATPAPGTRP